MVFQPVCVVSLVSRTCGSDEVVISLQGGRGRVPRRWWWWWLRRDRESESEGKGRVASDALSDFQMNDVTRSTRCVRSCCLLACLTTSRMITSCLDYLCHRRASTLSRLSTSPLSTCRIAALLIIGALFCSATFLQGEDLQIFKWLTGGSRFAQFGR